MNFKANGALPEFGFAKLWGSIDPDSSTEEC